MDALNIIQRRIKILEESLEEAKQIMKDGLKTLQEDGIDTSDYYQTSAMCIMRLQVRINELYKLQIHLLGGENSYGFALAEEDK